MLNAIIPFLGFTPTIKVFHDTNPGFKKSKPLTPLAKRIRDYLMAKSSGLTALEALAHFQGMTSATLARRITEIARAGWPIIRESKLDVMTGRRYTRYRLDFDKDWPTV